MGCSQHGVDSLDCCSTTPLLWVLYPLTLVRLPCLPVGVWFCGSWANLGGTPTAFDSWGMGCHGPTTYQGYPKNHSSGKMHGSPHLNATRYSATETLGAGKSVQARGLTASHLSWGGHSHHGLAQMAGAAWWAQTHISASKGVWILPSPGPC